jgi:hypothetical protein
VPDWLEFILLGIAWTPVSVLLHELGHAFAALVLTDGEVSIGMNALGGWATYEPERLAARATWRGSRPPVPRYR